MAVALLAAATTAITMRSHPFSADRSVAANTMSIGELTAGAGKLPTDEFYDQSLIYSTKHLSEKPHNLAASFSQLLKSWTVASA